MTTPSLFLLAAPPTFESEVVPSNSGLGWLLLLASAWLGVMMLVWAWQLRDHGKRRR
jgi:hypothetical protein